MSEEGGQATSQVRPCVRRVVECQECGSEIVAEFMDTAEENRDAEILCGACGSFSGVAVKEAMLHA